MGTIYCIQLYFRFCIYSMLFLYLVIRDDGCNNYLFCISVYVNDNYNLNIIILLFSGLQPLPHGHP